VAGAPPGGRQDRLIELNVEDVVTPSGLVVGPGIAVPPAVCAAAEWLGGSAARAMLARETRSRRFDSPPSRAKPAMSAPHAAGKRTTCPGFRGTPTP
jgi:hypothetical protein